ncbi:MAG TPA: DUF2059 domain-containing protein [Erythrobacter sp.]|nr:DUF2059 domain-containing protein [Erythrobacter sp.]
MKGYSVLLRWAATFSAAAFLTITAQAQQAPPLPPPPPLFEAAPPVSADPDHPAFGDLIDAMQEAVDQDAAMAAMSASIAREYAKVPEIAALEAAKPGLIDAVVAAMQPTLVTLGERVQQDYRPRMQALMARHLTSAEAGDLAAFYRSPLGRKLLTGASRSLTMENTLSGVGTSIADGVDPADLTVARSQVEKDITGAALSGVRTLSDDDLLEMGRVALRTPALLKMNTMLPEIITLRTAMENEQPNAAEVAAIEEAVVLAVTRHIGG